MKSDLFMFSRKKYNLYKLLTLYWAQNPHSKGAYLLYKYVIQKPILQEEEEESHSYMDDAPKKESYRIIDGYTPPPIAPSNSSSEEDEEEEQQSTTLHISLSSHPKEVHL